MAVGEPLHIGRQSIPQLGLASVVGDQTAQPRRALFMAGRTTIEEGVVLREGVQKLVGDGLRRCIGRIGAPCRQAIEPVEHDIGIALQQLKDRGAISGQHPEEAIFDRVHRTLTAVLAGRGVALDAILIPRDAGLIDRENPAIAARFPHASGRRLCLSR